MENETRDEAGEFTDAEALAARICDLLGQEPLKSRLLAALGLSREALEPGLPVVREPSSGPVPVGPYEIMPEFGELRWDGARPAGGEWAEVKVDQTPQIDAQALPSSAGPRPGHRGRRV